MCCLFLQWTKPMKRKPRVIIALDAAYESQRAILHGVISFMKKGANWNCHFTLVGRAMREAVQRAASADGMILDGQFAKENLSMLKGRVVAVGGSSPPTLPRVYTN